MEIVVKNTAEVWRSSGRPGKESQPIPEEAFAAIRATYNNGKSGLIVVRNSQDLAQCREFLREMKRAARHLGKVLKTQPYKASDITDRLVYRLTDKETK